MRTANLGFHGDLLPEHAFMWIIAFDAFDFGDSGPLEEALRSEQPIPDELRPALADIISGRRKPNLKAAAKLKIPAAERMKAAGALSTVLGLIDSFKHDDYIDTSCYSEKRIEGRLYDMTAEKKGFEPGKFIEYLNSAADESISETMDMFGVSRETVENLLRDLRKKIRDYPNI